MYSTALIGQEWLISLWVYVQKGSINIYAVIRLPNTQNKRGSDPRLGTKCTL